MEDDEEAEEEAAGLSDRTDIGGEMPVVGLLEVGIIEGGDAGWETIGQGGEEAR